MARLIAFAVVAAAACPLFAGDAPARGPELVAPKVAALPAVDGKADDPAWAQAKELVVPIDKPDELEHPKHKVVLKAVHDGDSICFLLVWEDKKKSDEHLPFVWKENDGEYVPDDEKIEDACSLGFALEGEFNPDMLAGVESKWDVWEWQAGRTTNGYALDKTHIYSRARPEGVKSKRFQDRKEKPIFLARPDDAGTPAWKRLEPPSEKKGPKLPQFEPQTPSGSAADVQARGVWADGKWTVEFKRKLNTGHPDDAVFSVGKAIEFAVAIFDETEHSDHDVSGKLILKLQP